MTSIATTTLALKEWAAVARALLDGRQTLLLRKGGIHEKRFEAAAADDEGGFLIFPTVAHSHAERVRTEHRDVLDRGAEDVDGDASVLVRCGVRLVDAVPVQRPERLPEVADLHVWTDESVRTDRLEFRPKHPLHALVVRAFALPEPVRLEKTAEHRGCRSWLQLPLHWDGRSGTPVHEPGRLVQNAARVRDTLG
ncbi:DUF1802 family protein [Egibacter rhizosphaerae]|uniref:DUF1802 family protein n=1 Tax=Egibacter rhizosphaerae TaxID=1670831 RepID=A0A411YKM3_9ACTN|nr:DUF1802 family protein [Egibacter rhizosphaerae]QBI21733.1 DUF1802 family protein [Egibacter rhizosphaerae]